MTGHSFLPKKGNYQDLLAYRIAEIVYDLTFHFCRRFLPRGDRTIDQMVQAARSGKQNIAICLLHQTHYLLDQYLRRLQQDFLKTGGLREQMKAARLASRKKSV